MPKRTLVRAFVLFALLSAEAAAFTAPAGAADFGAPPSGEIPILYNDHTVYATPDVLVRRRVLAALVRDGQIFVPLRSMFEQMGATVTASGDGRTVNAAKSGASVSVTLGKAEVIVNGETRPLDVPPMMYRGVMVVPIRVLSEALGAYVQWVPSRRVVVVRYVTLAPPSPPPTAPPTAPPTPAPRPSPTAAPATPAPFVPIATPTPVPTEAPYRAFVQAAYSRGRNDNEFVAGTFCDTILFSAAYVFKDSPLAVKFDYRQDVYVSSDNLTDAIGNHYTRFSTIDGGTAFTPVFMAHQTTLDVRLEMQVAQPRIALGVAYLHQSNNYGSPKLDGIGFGVEKLPELRSGISFYGSAFYYPVVSGSYTVNFGASPNFGRTYREQYQLWQYDIGLAAAFAHSPAYVYGGFGGTRSYVKQNAPVGQIHDGPYIGLGVKI